MSTVSGRSGVFVPDRPVPCIRPVWDPGCNTTRPLPSGGPVGRMGGCEKEPAVILVSDQAQADLQGSGHGVIFRVGSGVVFDLVAQDEVGAGVTSLGGGEVLAQLRDGGGGATGG